MSHPELGGSRGPLRRAVEGLVDVAIRRPFLVIVVSILCLVAAKQYISGRLELRSPEGAGTLLRAEIPV